MNFTKSESLSKLAPALVKFQGEMKAVEKNAINPFFKSKYLDLAGVWEAIRDPLSKNGLSIVQIPAGDTLVTMLLHISGEYISGEQRLAPKNHDPQSIGSAISYARRYGISAVLGVVADEDDDGNAATKPVTHQQQKSTPALTVLGDDDAKRYEADKRKFLFDTLKKRGVEEELYEVIAVAMKGKTTKDLDRVVDEVRKKISLPT